MYCTRQDGPNTYVYICMIAVRIGCVTSELRNKYQSMIYMHIIGHDLRT